MKGNEKQPTSNVREKKIGSETGDGKKLSKMKGKKKKKRNVGRIDAGEGRRSYRRIAARGELGKGRKDYETAAFENKGRKDSKQVEVGGAVLLRGSGLPQGSQRPTSRKKQVKKSNRKGKTEAEVGGGPGEGNRCLSPPSKDKWPAASPLDGRRITAGSTSRIGKKKVKNER